MIGKKAAAIVLSILLLFTLACGSTDNVETAPEIPPEEPTNIPPTETEVPPTETPEPTPTNTPTATPVPTATATPIPTTQVDGDGNLRRGPGTVYPVIELLPDGTSLILLEKTSDEEWFKVEVEGTGEEGWIHISVIKDDFDPDAIPVASSIPPTPTPLPATWTPVPTNTPVPPTAPPATDVPTPVLPLDCHVTVINQLSVGLTYDLNGPYRLTYPLSPGQSMLIHIPAGTYNYCAYATGYTPLCGVETWEPGEWELVFYDG